MELQEKIRDFLRRTFTPKAYKRDQLLEKLPPEQRLILADLQGASVRYQEVLDSRSGLAHFADPTDLREATMDVLVRNQTCRDEQLPQELIDCCTPALIRRSIQENGYPRILPIGRGMAS